MACYSPLHAYKGPPLPNGKTNIVWRRGDSFRGERLDLPCGQCVGCRLERSRQWAMRCVHEASLYDDNCFLTLTYDDEHLPDGSTLVLRDFQLFLKKLRKKFPTPSPGIRFFHCGEYGDQYQRPHYHCLLFNFEFPDKVLHEDTGEFKTYTSPTLTKLWGNGFAVIGALTFESAAYTARYVLKKVTGKNAPSHYKGRKPEYTTMSRRPGIGKLWFDKFHDEVYPNDEVIVRGRQVQPPKFYDQQLEKTSPDLHQQIKTKRKKDALLFAVDDYDLRIKEEVKIASMRSLKRKIE